MIPILIDVPEATNPQAFQILLPLGLLLLFAKVFALLLTKIHVPQVIGYLLAGLVVGLIYLIPGQQVLTTYTDEGLDFFSKIGVILIMFSAGIETDMKKVKSVGLCAFLVALIGVLTPMFFCFDVAIAFDANMANFNGTEGIDWYTDLYYGVILTATSVSITVATLKELKQLDSKVGATLVSASIIDDIMGIIVLSLVLSLSGHSSSGTDLASITLNALPNNLGSNAAMRILFILLFMAVYFAITIFAGHYIKKLFNWLGTKYPHHIRITILSLALCFIWSFAAEYFNIADITGAYLMGLILSSTVAHGFLDHRAETTVNYLFGPIFFGTIALGMYKSNFDFSDPAFVMFLIFGLCWIAVGLIGKIVGCSVTALCFKFRFNDALKVGFGMMARAEVLIVCAQKGVDAGLVSSDIMAFCLLLILISSFLTPIFLKASFHADEKHIEKLEKEGKPIPQDVASEEASMKEKNAEIAGEKMTSAYVEPNPPMKDNTPDSKK